MNATQDTQVDCRLGDGSAFAAVYFQHGRRGSLVVAQKGASGPRKGQKST